MVKISAGLGGCSSQVTHQVDAGSWWKFLPMKALYCCLGVLQSWLVISHRMIDPREQGRSSHVFYDLASESHTNTSIIFTVIEINWYDVGETTQSRNYLYRGWEPCTRRPYRRQAYHTNLCPALTILTIRVRFPVPHFELTEVRSFTLFSSKSLTSSTLWLDEI